MIELLNLYKEEKQNKHYLFADVSIDGVREKIWFSFDTEYSNYVTLDNGDAFVLILFIYAIFNEKSFISKVPVSNRLKNGLVEILLLSYCKVLPNTNKLKFDFELVDYTKYNEANAVGTAMSLGVDSFYTITSNFQTNHPIDYITLFNAGAYGQYGGDEVRLLFESMKEYVSNFAEEQNLKFLWVDTNFNEILKMPFVKTHTFRNFACVLIFQKLFKTYYYASGITIDQFKLNINDPAYYDILNTKAIAGNSLEFFVSGLNEGRLEKTSYIANFDLTYNNLNVCLLTTDNKDVKKENSKLKNCSKCFKCIRTMVTLDVLGKLELYKSVFDLDVFYKNKNKYLAEIIYLKFRSNNIFSKDILRVAKTTNYKIPFSVYYFLVLRILQPIIRKFKE